MKINKILVQLFSLSIITLAACSKDRASGKGFGIPEVEPPVEAATPSALADAARAALYNRVHSIPYRDITPMVSPEFDMSNFQDRLFGVGPTVIFEILASIDDRIAEINTRSADSSSDCLTQDPVAYTVTPFGLNEESFDMNLQCYDDLSDAGDATNYLMFGKKDDSFSLLEAVGAAYKAIQVTPVTGETDKFEVLAYMGVGYTNTPTWYDMSYAALSLKANSATNSVEIAFAGVGVGFCGVHLKSDGSKIYVSASQEGAGVSCDNDVVTACLDASDLSDTTGCDDIDDDNFELTSIGRMVTDADHHSLEAALLPAAGGNVLLDGTDSDAIHFFPTAATDVDGVGEFK